MEQQVKAITEDKWKWDIASLLSLILTVIGFQLITENTRTWPIAVPLIVAGIILSAVFQIGPKLKREGKLSKSFLRSYISKLFQKLTIIKIPLSVNGAILGYKKEESIVRILKGHPSGVSTWEKFLEIASYNNKGSLTFMELNTVQKGVLAHKEVNQRRIPTFGSREKRLRMMKYVEGVKELENIPGTTAIVIETYKGSTPERNLSQYGNIESKGIDVKAFLDVLRGIPTVLRTLVGNPVSSKLEAVSTAFEFVGGREPSIGNRYCKFLRVTDFDPTKDFSKLLDICREKFAEPMIILESMPPKDALKILEGQRNKQIVNRATSKGTDGKNGQSDDKEDERFEKIKELERRIREGELTYKVFMKIRCVRNNTPDLRDDAEALLQELELNGYEAVIPENQDDIVKEMITMDPGDETFGFYMLAKDLASVLSPLVKKSQMFAEPEGFSFGVADYGERVMKNILKLLSGGIGLIIGSMGTGKSYLMAGMAYFMSLTGNRVIIFDPAGKGLKDVSFTRLFSSTEGATAIICKSLNIFDMFEDVEIQKTYQRGAVSILFKDISNGLVNIICQKANEFRDESIIPTFEILKESFQKEKEILEEKQQPTDFIQSIKKEDIYLKNLREVLLYISSVTNEDQKKWFQTTPEGLKYPSDPEIAANGLIGIDFSLINDDFAKRAIINLALFQMQTQMLQEIKIPTILFVDELHSVVGKNDLLGSPNSEAIIKELSIGGRKHKMIMIGAAQLLEKLIESNAGEYLVNNSSWLVQLGRSGSEEFLINLGAESDDIEYLRKLTASEVGSGLLIVKGEKPLQFQVDYASYIHELITGETKSSKSDRKLERVLRIEDFEKKYHQSLKKTMGYRSIRHKDLDGERRDFFLKKTEDPELTIDLFLLEKYLEKQGIKVDTDYENGLISVEDRTLLYVQPYGNTPLSEWLVGQLDKETDSWFIIYHDNKFVKPIATDALKPRLIALKDISLSVQKIIEVK